MRPLLNKHVLFVGLSLIILIGSGCDEPITTTETGGGSAQYDGPPTSAYMPYAGVEASSAGSNTQPPTSGQTTPAPPPFTPPPGARLCEFKEQCNEGQYCYREYCVDQQPCGPYAGDATCPTGFLCLDGLCFEDGGEGSCLSVSPGDVNFGEVARGDVATREVTLSACGTSPVSVTQVALDNSTPDMFSVNAATPITVAPGQTATFSVSYSPRMVGVDFGNVTVSSTDFNNPSQNVSLSATATPPALEDTGLHVRLEWSTNQTDVDLHVLGPNADIWDCDLDCNFSNPAPQWGDPQSDLDDPYLDLDDVDGFGPENINIQEPAPGVYTIIAHYWADHDGDVPFATVHALSYGEVVATIGPQPLNDVGDIWYAFEIEFPGNIVRPINRTDFSSAEIPFCK